MKKVLISVFTLLVVLEAFASPAFAYESKYDDGTDLSYVEQVKISYDKGLWNYYYAVYIDAKEEKNTVVMEQALKDMNVAHARAVSVRARHGSYFKDENMSKYLNDLCKFNGDCYYEYNEIVLAIYQYDSAYDDYKEGVISYEMMSYVQEDSVKTIETIKEQVNEK